jgi:hypothetical protein
MKIGHVANSLLKVLNIHIDLMTYIVSLSLQNSVNEFQIVQSLSIITTPEHVSFIT